MYTKAEATVTVLCMLADPQLEKREYSGQNFAEFVFSLMLLLLPLQELNHDVSLLGRELR